MRIRDLFLETWDALVANKGRSLLTILGIVIGISAVIAMTSLIGGVQQSLVSQLGLDQSRIVYINYYKDQPLTTEDLRTIENGVSDYDFITGLQYGSAKASTDTKQVDTNVMGITGGFFRAMGSKLVDGRLLTDKELDSDAMVVVVDVSLARSLFGEDESAVGKQVMLGNDTYSILGVIESNNMLSSQGTAYLPFRTSSLRITGYTDFSQIVGFAAEGVDVQALTQSTETFIRDHYRITEEDEADGFGYVFVQSVESIQNEMNATIGSFQLMMTVVAGISLLVGGIGIMNMMLTNVTERIREIGLRKSLGAHRSDITAQFLMESVAICLVGGLIGILLGVGAAWGLSTVFSGALGDLFFGEATNLTPYVSPSMVLFSVAVCVGIGVLFGFWPARRAAKLDPVESLRYQ